MRMFVIPVCRTFSRHDRLLLWQATIMAAMFPVLFIVQYRLSKREECEMIEIIGMDTKTYMAPPMFIPKPAGRG